jgi:hypothetical protein
MDLINQGKGPVAQIWGTSNEIILRKIKIECDENNVNFYNPELDEKSRMLLFLVIKENK